MLREAEWSVLTLFDAGVGVVFRLAGDGNAKGAEKAEIIRGERQLGWGVSDGDFDLLGLFGGKVVESDSGLEHQQNIEAVSADILDHAGDLLALDDRLMDRLAKLLNEFAQTCRHNYLQWPWPARGSQRGLRRGFLYLTSAAARQQEQIVQSLRGRFGNVAATIIDGMRPQSIGRALGIGLRVAGRIATERLAGGAETAVQGSAASPAGQTKQAAGRAAGQTAKGVARGVGGFLRPFQRLGAILWLEVTGAFFFIFVLVSASFLWKNRASYAQGPDHREFLASAAMMAVFLYLGVSSFWRARRR